MAHHFGRIMQMGYVVADLDAAARHWSQVLGVGPFFVADAIPYETVHFRGRPIALSTRVAIAYHGDMQIELIQQVSGDPSTFTEFVQRRGGGLHHVCALTDDLGGDVAAWAARGVPVLQGGRTAVGIGFAYLDTGGGFDGALLELVEGRRGLLRYFETIRKAADEWDGREPLRMA